VCKAHFLSPEPSEQQLSQAYDDSYYGRSIEKFGELTERALDLFRKQKAAFVARHVPDQGNILDVGCGNGRFLKNTLSFGRFNLYGIEMPGRSAERAARIPEISLKVGNLRENEFPDSFFDAVTLFHVFEHLTEPSSTLGTISRILKGGGVCVMSFPNIDSFQARIFKGKWLHLDPPRHRFYFEPDDFIEIASGFGFVVEKISFVSLEQNPYGMIQSILNCFLSKREVLFEWLKGNSEYVRDSSAASLILQACFFVSTFPLFVLADVIESLFKKGATVQFVLRKN
jgi:SAM-dependent methyltransferase